MSQLPVSDALSEASPDSITELFNRDPEQWTDRDLEQIVTEMRAQRERYEAAEAAGGIRRTRAPKEPSAPREPITKAPPGFSVHNLGRPKLDIRPITGTKI